MKYLKNSAEKYFSNDKCNSSCNLLHGRGDLPTPILYVPYSASIRNFLKTESCQNSLNNQIHNKDKFLQHMPFDKIGLYFIVALASYENSVESIEIFYISPASTHA